MDSVTELTVLRALSMFCATIIVIVGASIAKRTVAAHDARWWVVVGGFAVAALTVWAGVLLFAQDYFMRV